MTRKIQRSLLSGFPWYAVLFAVYPPLALLAHNIGEIEFDAAWRAILLSAGAVLFLLWVLYAMFRDWAKSGLLVSLAVIGFFFYGHVFGYVRGLHLGDIIIGRHTYFIFLWLGLFSFIAWKLIRLSSQGSGLQTGLLAASLVLVLFPSWQLIAYRFEQWQNSRITAPAISLPAESSGNLPDIYFIILDMYGRHDVLLQDFGYDDSAFLNELRDLGFYVASCSQSNYHSTAYSLSADLNADYLQQISDQFDPENRNTTLMWQLIQDSAVKAALQEKGYAVYAFETGYNWTEWHDAAHFYRSPSKGINDFEDLLLRNSLVSVFSEKGLLDRFRLTSNQRKHALSIYVLNELEKIPSLPGPKFVFVHLTIPHPPFVFGPEGSLQVIPMHEKGNEQYYVKDEYKTGYRNQLAFLNQRVPQVLRTILETSSQPPVIFLQGDHGPRFVDIDKQLAILNAYYFPEPRPAFNPWMTPVNNFRLVFNAYFGASLPLLPDHSYYSEGERPYAFTEVSNRCVPSSDQ